MSAIHERWHELPDYPPAEKRERKGEMPGWIMFAIILGLIAAIAWIAISSA
jgi:hypothetical protein